MIESLFKLMGICAFHDRLRSMAVYWMDPGECQDLSQPVRCRCCSQCVQQRQVRISGVLRGDLRVYFVLSSSSYLSPTVNLSLGDVPKDNPRGGEERSTNRTRRIGSMFCFVLELVKGK